MYKQHRAVVQCGQVFHHEDAMMACLHMHLPVSADVLWRDGACTRAPHKRHVRYRNWTRPGHIMALSHAHNACTLCYDQQVAGMQQVLGSRLLTRAFPASHLLARAIKYDCHHPGTRAGVSKTGFVRAGGLHSYITLLQQGPVAADHIACVSKSLGATSNIHHTAPLKKTPQGAKSW